MDNWLKISPLNLEVKLRSPWPVGHLNCRQVSSGFGGWGGMGLCQKADFPGVKNEADV